MSAAEQLDEPTGQRRGPGLVTPTPATTSGGPAGGVRSLSRARGLSRALLVGLVPVLLGAASCSPAQTADSGPPASTAPSTERIEFLLNAAAADFRAQGARRPVSFRNVRSGYLVSEGTRQDRLCGEFLPASTDGKADWIPFVTIRTSPYEQWLGGQAVQFCKDAAMKWDEDDLSSRLLRRFDP
jgi:hypothetical protein